MALKPCQGCGKEVDETAAACPGCGRPKPTATMMDGLWKLGFAGLVAILWIGMCMKLGKDDAPAGGSPQAAAAPAAPPAPPIPVTAVALHRAYDDNEVSADSKFKGRPLLVDGVIDSIDKNFTNGIVLRLRSGQMFASVMAHLKPSQSDPAGELKKRQRVELLCVGGTRIINSATLDDCEISATWK